MIGFIGTRLTTDRPDGLMEQRVTCRTQEEVDFWKGVFPDPENPGVAWESEMVLRLGNHRIYCQSTEERDQWRKTFLMTAGTRPLVRWLGNKELLLGTEVINNRKEPAAANPAAVVDLGHDLNKLDTLTDSQLRTAAIEHGVQVDPDEPRAITHQKLLDVLTAPPEPPAPA